LGTFYRLGQTCASPRTIHDLLTTPDALAAAGDLV
jgi:hypothetical protein